MFARDTSDTGLFSKIYRELLKLSSERANDLMKKRAEDLNRRLPGEDTRTANPLMETHPTVRVVRETPTEMKRQQPTPVRRRTPGAAARRRRGRRVPGGVLRSGHSRCTPRQPCSSASAQGLGNVHTETSTCMFTAASFKTDKSRK